jgi:L-amino acid N-acyltransferase YncA
MGDEVTIRRARRSDCPAILEIYNDAVRHTTATYDTEPQTLESRHIWFDAHAAAGDAIFVAEADGRVVGWSSLTRYHPRPGYRFTVEDSIYIAEPWRGRGIGGRLLAPLIESARERDLHVILAGIDAENEASIRLHARHGFEHVGRFREVGHKFGRWLDVIYMQRTL